MQQKREEQKKSIDAYRSQQCSGYNALLSEVANELHKRITPISIVKDNVEYHDVFSGKEIVVRYSWIIK
jgi:hypothetical protein